MSDDTKDLDALLPTDKSVKLGGVAYNLPGDLPMEIYLRVSKAGTMEDSDEEAALNEAVAAVVDLFAYYHKGTPSEGDVRRNVEAVLKSRGIRFNTTLLREIYGASPVEEAAEEESPTSAS